jgi:hypothetical protein
MMVAAGMTWGPLVLKYGADKLIDFGYRWEDMLSSGFNGRHLRTLSKTQLSRLGINATRALECRPNACDISAIGYSADELRSAGWTVDLLEATGLDMRTMVAFGIPLQQWRDVLGLTEPSRYGFTSYAVCANAGWDTVDIDNALQVNAARAPRAPRAPRTQGPIEIVL